MRRAIGASVNLVIDVGRVASPDEGDKRAINQFQVFQRLLGACVQAFQYVFHESHDMASLCVSQLALRRLYFFVGFFAEMLPVLGQKALAAQNDENPEGYQVAGDQ